MDINTGKLVSNSTSLFKKIKENDSNNKVSKVDINQKKVVTNQILNNIQDIDTNDKTFKAKFIKINNFLSSYENELSKLQFVEQKLDTIQQLLTNDSDKNEIQDVINNSLYDNKKILNEYIKNPENIKESLTHAETIITQKYSDLNKAFKEIEITTQNLISIYKQPVENSLNNLNQMNFEKIIQTTKLNNKRVMDLIS